MRDLPIHLLHEGHEVPYNSPEWTLTFWVKAATATNDQDLFYLDQGALVITLGTDRSIQVSFPTSLGEGQVGTDGSLVSADYTFVAVQLAANFNNAGVYSAAGAVNGYDINPFTGSYIGPTSHFVHMFIPNLAGGNAGISVANANFYDRILAKDELSAMKTAGCQSCQ